MTATKPLSDTQLAILAHAAARDDLAILPTPASLKARGGALQVVLGSLIDRGLIEEIGSAEGLEWRRDEEGQRLTLRIGTAGLAALGLGDETDDAVPNGSSHPGDRHELAAAAALAGGGAAATHDDVAPMMGQQPEAKRAEWRTADNPASGPSTGKGLRPGTTGANVLAMLARETGASVPEMMEASGWQAHSVRGFLSGTVKKKLGLEVTSARDDSGERRYRVG